ncbi:glutamine-tRNA ligase [Sphaceloma murrayae]|uniref:Glutamine-tRNA ligase n=1 Tax=Sphaceloma murrayae TaxID=2082308 RepID=A0A2K1QKC3_9PEZI|nr:glutamine-tRNA ligase [Sphaceloma murrayae]
MRSLVLAYLAVALGVHALDAVNQLDAELFRRHALLESDGPLPNTTCNNNTSLASRTPLTYSRTPTGSAYASRCQSRHFSWSSAQSSWSSEHQYVKTQTYLYGGYSRSVVTDYAAATTLCDGHPRVLKSPAIPTRTRTTTYSSPGQSPTSSSLQENTYWFAYPSPSPTCSISPTDCDTLWKAYSISMSSYASLDAVGTNSRAQITQAPRTPFCMNQTVASSWYEVTKSMYGCGDCTIYGEDVKLLFFPVPTTVSRDMCASTPLARETHFSIVGDAIEVYAGKSYGQKPAPPGAVTAVVDQHTLTSGTAYISIGKVYAADRCSKDYGTTVSDVIIAMHSESVLSLRYSQGHYQYFGSSSTQTGYPVSYADFNNPIPWSAWNGQAVCYGPRWGAGCDIIYEDEYRPQLAIPAGIRKLDPRWASCQNWYGGLYDPPLTLQTQETFAVPTFSASLTATHDPATTTAAPASPFNQHISSTAQPSDSRVLAPNRGAPSPLPLVRSDDASDVGSAPPLAPGPVVISKSVPKPTSTLKSDPAALEPPASSQVITVNGKTHTAFHGGGSVIFDGQPLATGGAAVTLTDGGYVTLGPEGLVFQSRTQTAAPFAGTTVASFGGEAVTVVASPGAKTATVGSQVLSVGGRAMTLPGGTIATLGPDGLALVGPATGLGTTKQSSSAGEGSNTSGGDSQSTTTYGGVSSARQSAQQTATSTSDAPARKTSMVYFVFAMAMVISGYDQFIA